MAGQRAPEVPRVAGLEQILNDTINLLLETAPTPFSTQDDTASQPGPFSQQTPFQASSSQQTTLESHQQKPACDGSNATEATVPADASLEAPESNFELVKPLRDRSESSLQVLASYSGQAVALEQVKIAV